MEDAPQDVGHEMEDGGPKKVAGDKEGKKNTKTKQLSTELMAARQANIRMGAELEAERRVNVASQQQIVDLQTQLATMTEKCQHLDRALASGEEDDRIFRDTQGARESILEDEVNRLRRDIMAAEQRHLEAADLSSLRISRLEDTVAHHADESRRLVARAVEAESRLETAQRELQRAREDSSAEQARLAQALAAEERNVEALRQQLAECEQRAADEANKLRFRLNELREKEHQTSEKTCKDDDDDDGDEETGKPFVTGIDANAAEGGAEVIVLRKRLEILEARCGALQQKLNSRPIVFQKPASDNVGAALGGGGLAMQWEPKLRSAVGPEFAALVVRFYNAPHRMLRKFTQKLLEHDAWLWLFYMHLVVLYTIVASFHAHANSSASPVDVINKHMNKAAQNAWGR